MNPSQLLQIRHWFEEYAGNFLAGADGLRPLFELKRVHSCRVAGITRALARRLDWTAEEVRAAEAMGWLHDIGRFTQLAEFKTLDDRRSVHHGRRSCEVIEQSGLLVESSDGERKAILDGILHHNQPAIAEGLPPLSLRFAKLIRDADKVDILWHVQHEVRSGMVDRHPEIILGVDRTSRAVNPEVLAEIRTGRPGSYQHIRTLSDFFLIQLSWVYDLNYAATFDLLAVHGTMKTLVDHLPDTPEVNEAVGTLLGEFDRRSTGRAY